MAEGLLEGGLLFDLLLEEAVDLVDVFEGEVGVLVGAWLVFANPDEKLVFLVVGENFAHFPDQIEMDPVDDLGQNPAHRGKDVDRRVVVLAGQVGGEDDVAVENRANFVGDRLVEIVPRDENRLKSSDRSFL